MLMVKSACYIKKNNESLPLPPNHIHTCTETCLPWRSPWLNVVFTFQFFSCAFTNIFNYNDFSFLQKCNQTQQSFSATCVFTCENLTVLACMDLPHPFSWLHSILLHNVLQWKQPLINRLPSTISTISAMNTFAHIFVR